MPTTEKIDYARYLTLQVSRITAAAATSYNGNIYMMAGSNNPYNYDGYYKSQYRQVNTCGV
ncbi:hypothetical protein ACOBV9_18110 (plasmid) [Pseudoalteromonas espejiana]